MNVVDVPVMVFSEAMRDIDLFVGATSIGADSNWRDGGEEGFHGYWSYLSFGELTTTGAEREKLLEELGLSSVDLDGSHRPAVRGGPEVEYQARKRRRTIHALYLTDSQGLPLATSEPASGDHNDLHGIEAQSEVATATLECRCGL